MFSHMMVGSNDLERSKKFYDQLFSKPGRQDDKGRLSYGRKGSVFMVSQPIDGQPATFGNGSTIGFAFDSPEEVDEWQRAGVWERLHALLLSELRAAGELEWSRAVADSSHVQAKKGAPRRARARLIEPDPAPSTTFS